MVLLIAYSHNNDTPDLAEASVETMSRLGAKFSLENVLVGLNDVSGTIAFYYFSRSLSVVCLRLVPNESIAVDDILISLAAFDALALEEGMFFF